MLTNKRAILSKHESYTERKAKQEPSGYALSLICSFDKTKNKHNFYRGRDGFESFVKI